MKRRKSVTALTVRFTPERIKMRIEIIFVEHSHGEDEHADAYEEHVPVDSYDTRCFKDG